MGKSKKTKKENSNNQETAMQDSQNQGHNTKKQSLGPNTKKG